MKRNGSDKENEHDTRSPNFGLNATEKTRRDGGCSWLVCLAGFLIQSIVGAQGNISGIIFAGLLDKYNDNSRSQTGKLSFYWRW